MFKNVLSFWNKGDYILLRRHDYEKRRENKVKDVMLKEVGTSFETGPFQILLGIVIQPDSKRNEHGIRL